MHLQTRPWLNSLETTAIGRSSTESRETDRSSKELYACRTESKELSIAALGSQLAPTNSNIVDSSESASIGGNGSNRKTRGKSTFGEKASTKKTQRKIDRLKKTATASAFGSADDNLEAALKTRASEKFAAGDFEGVTLTETVELFTILSRSETALVPFKVVAALLTELIECSNVEMDVLRQHMNINEGGVVSAQQFHRAINIVSNRTLLRQVHSDMLRRGSMDAVTENVHVERDFFVNRVNWSVDRDDALGTLPMTCLYMAIFMCLVIFHLQIWRRGEVETGLESWIQNQGKDYYGPFLLEHVFSVGTFNTWMQNSGLRGLLGDVRNYTDGLEIRMGNTNVLVGDVFLRQYHGKDFTERTQWLLHNQWGQASLAVPGQEADFLKAAVASTDYLLNPSNKWIDEETKRLEVVFCTYNNHAEMYAISQVRLRLDSYGYVRPRVKSKAILSKAYPVLSVLVIDALYVLYIFQVIYDECKDMCAAIRLGFKEFLDYWTFWNAVDWIAICFGFINMGLWIACLMAMRRESLQKLLNDQDKMMHGVMSLQTGQLDQIHDDLRRNDRIVFALHISIAVTTVFIVLKFFKGFQANPRLQTVTMTLRCVGTDVLHFFIVFATIFASFAVIGHVLFGSDITKFYTLASSFNTGITVLMGEFDWYVEIAESPDTLPSGMPRVFLFAWFLFYMFFVLLVMLNMLLAIILERYTEVAQHLSNRADARSLWQQMYRFLRRQKQTRGFIPLYRIRRDLENDANPGHPAQIVTENSLQEAFPAMSETQSKWIMAFLEQELKDRGLEAKDDDETSRAKRTERFVQSIAEELHAVSDVITNCSSRIQSLERSLKSGRSARSTSESENASSTFKELTGISQSSDISYREANENLAMANG